MFRTETGFPVKRLRVECLGHFACFPDEKRTYLQWRTRKAEELFAFLIHHGGNPVPRAKILDTIWPRFHPEQAARNLHATSWSIRSTLGSAGCDGLFLRSRTYYRVDMEAIDCDAHQFTAFVQRMTPGDTGMDLMEQALTLYNGPYLADWPYEWAAGRRRWLKNEHEKLQYALAAARQQAGLPQQALDLYKMIIRSNPLAGKAYETFITLSLEQGEELVALMYFREYSDVLDKQLGLRPPPRLSQLIQDIRTASTLP